MSMEIGVYHEFHCRPEQTPAEAFEEALAQIEAADRWGLDAIWLAEIHQQPRRSVLTAPLAVASAIAARTCRIKIGTGVQVLPLCHPLRLAEETATIDQISQGRLLFGVGRSGNPRSYVAYGVPYSESRERFLETLEIIKRAWTQPTFSYEGKYYSFTNASAVPQPYQQPCPPIRVAAASEETFPSPGEAGYPIFVAVRSGSLSGLAPDLAAYRAAYKAAGHPGEGEVYLRLTLHIADTHRQALEEAETSIMSGYRTLSTRLENSLNRRRAAEAQTVRTISYEEVRRDKVIIGGPEYVADRLQQLHEELGLNGILAELNFGAFDPAGTDDAVIAASLRKGHAPVPLNAESYREPQHRAHSDDAYRQPAATGGPGAHDVRQRRRRPGRPRSAQGAHPLGSCSGPREAS
jgi:alkanesulfonate monooxygenase SsuD/methylene tetrahydromethanopterin reductase-like flavin-dependent oxidoreductase (luciferase family)